MKAQIFQTQKKKQPIKIHLSTKLIMFTHNTQSGIKYIGGKKASTSTNYHMISFHTKNFKKNPIP